MSTITSIDLEIGKELGKLAQYVESVTFIAAGVGVMAALASFATVQVVAYPILQAISYAAFSYLAGRGAYLAAKPVIHACSSDVSKNWVRIGSWAVGCLAAAYAGFWLFQTFNVALAFKDSLLITVLSAGAGVALRTVTLKGLSYCSACLKPLSE